MRLEAYAKVNIGLIVGGRRPDGYHDIESYMALVDIRDTIDAEIRPSKSLSVEIESSVPYLEDGTMDLMEKAARIFSERFSLPFSLSLRIDKRIPSQAGLGGGSADGAAVLRFLFGRYGISEGLLETAAAVGSDVPFLASGYRTALVRGRGEIVEERTGLHGRPLAIFVPEERSSTGKAYALLDGMERPERHLPPLSPSLDKASFPNDFERVFPPQVPEAVIRSGAFVSLTGSGSAWYAIASEGEILPHIPGAISTRLM